MGKRDFGRPGEFELIERYFAPLSGEGSFGLRDDAALLHVTAGKELVVTQDAIAQGVHFLAQDPPDLVARKALRVNLSDLAAKGARPTAFSLALGLPPDWREEWLRDFASGLASDCAHYGLRLTGGDTFTSPGGVIVVITAWGEIAPGAYASRLGARPGDALYVTGVIGAGALGLLAHKGELPVAVDNAEALAQSYLLPDPPVAAAPVIAAHANAAMDISDGFVGDLGKLAAASRVDFDIRLGDIPIVAEADSEHLLRIALTGGDDYQFLLTADPKNEAEILHEARAAGIAVTRLGDAKAGSGRVRILREDGGELSFAHPAWTHF